MNCSGVEQSALSAFLFHSMGLDSVGFSEIDVLELIYGTRQTQNLHNICLLSLNYRFIKGDCNLYGTVGTRNST